MDGITQPITQETGTIPQEGSMNSNRTWQLVVQDERGATATRNATLLFLYKVYYGVAAEPGAIDSAFLLGLESDALTDTRARTVTVNPGDGQYIWYAVPASFGPGTFTVGGLQGGFSKVSTFSHTNASGGVTNYDVYRSDNYALGEITVTVS